MNNNGFQKIKEFKSNKCIRTSKTISRDDFEKDGMQGAITKLLKKLIKEILKENLLYIDCVDEFETLDKKFYGELTLCPPGTKFSEVQNEKFIVKGESFTEEDLIKAVKSTYPERFI